MGAEQLTSNAVSTSNSNRLIGVRHLFRRELVTKKGGIVVIHVNSEVWHADYLTKPLGTGDLESHRDIVMNSRVG